MNNANRILAAAALGFALSFTTATLAAADNSIKATLTAQQGKRVTLRLSGGEELSGNVGSVDGDTVRLTELAGKEFFDAVIRLDRIDAVVFRAREK